jgi:hypothetical protein
MSVGAPVPTLRPEERAGILTLLAAAARPMTDVVADFLSRFPRERRLRVGATLCFLLEASHDPRSSSPPLPFRLLSPLGLLQLIVSLLRRQIGSGDLFAAGMDRALARSGWLGAYVGWLDLVRFGVWPGRNYDAGSFTFTC